MITKKEKEVMEILNAKDCDLIVFVEGKEINLSVLLRRFNKASKKIYKLKKVIDHKISEHKKGAKNPIDKCSDLQIEINRLKEEKNILIQIKKILEKENRDIMEDIYETTNGYIIS